MTNTTILERRCWVFDLDGTLTVPKHDFAYIRKTLGVPDGKDILGYLAELPEEQSQPMHQWLDQIELDIARQTEAATGVVEFIEELERRGTQMGILTRNTQKHAALSLEVIGIRRYFPLPSILGRDEALPKPDPDGIMQLLSLWQGDSTETVMVGDYLYDLQTGRAAGTATIHVDNTRQFHWPALTDLGVGTLVELRDRLP